VSDTSDPAVIEDQLAETRARLGNHLDELTRRLSPGQLLDEGLGYLRNGQGAAFARNLGTQVRDNPLPVVLTGLGIAWLAAAGNVRGIPASRSRALVPYEGDGGGYAYDADSLASRAQRAGDAVSRAADETEATFRERVAEARAGVLGVMRQAQDTAATFGDRVQQAFDAARRSAHDGLDSVRRQARRGNGALNDAMARGRDYVSQAGDYASQAADYATRARDGIARSSDGLIGAVSDNPVVLGALGLAAGALLGALLPRTDVEDAYLGETAGQVAAGARDMAGDLVERGARVADAAMNAGYEAARDEGEEFAARRGGGDGAEADEASRDKPTQDARGEAAPPAPIPGNGADRQGTATTSVGP
jgi:hypothetical protein